jgi:signal transduction histidine kinase/DNA-binding response OmpR family regulator
VIALAYAAIAEAVMRSFGGRSLDVLLFTDVPVVTLAIYLSGGENSWLYPALLVTMAAAATLKLRRAIVLTVVTTAVYAVMLMWIVVVDGRPLSPAVIAVRLAVIAVVGLYLSLMARSIERRRERIHEKVSSSRDLVEEHRDARLRAEAGSAAKSEFLANVSHEMRTPLHGIMGMLQLAADGEASAERRHQLQMAIRSAETLLATIEDILDFTKIEARKLELEPVYFSLRELVGDTLKTVGVTAAQKGLELAFSFEPDVPDRVWGDPLRLRQILINLVGNAIKFTSQGHVVVRCSRESGRGDDLALRFAVSDTGQGIDAHKRATIFEPFANAEPSTTRTYGSSGLGLSIVARLVDAMGGTITVDSEPGRGSTFTFTVKFAHDEIEGVVAPQWYSALRGIRVLVVEPYATSREIIGDILRARGAVPELYASLDEALQPSIREAVSCVVIDARFLAATPWIPPVPVVEIISPISSIAPPSPTVTRPVAERELLDAIGVALGIIERRIAYTLERRVESDRPLTILVVDDHPVNLEFAAEALRRLGHVVVKAASGQDAVEVARTRKIDVALIDIQMPSMDGFEMLRRLRGMEGTRVRTIAMTAYTSHEDRERCLAAGFDDVLTKPVTQSRLAALLSGRQSSGDSIVDAVAGNMTLLARVRDAFAAQSPRLLATIHTAITDGDSDALYAAAHTLKGAISNFGDGDALAAAIDVERAGRAGDFTTAAALLPRLESTVADLEQRMTVALERNATG